MANQNYTVYKHTTPDGKIYIGITGKTLKYRWKNGGNYLNNRDFNNAISFYGWKNISHDVLAKELPAGLAEILEDYYIEKYNSRDPEFGYNRHAGGGIINDEQKKKLHYSSRNPIPVRCVETGEIFNNIREAANAKNSTKANISRSLKRGIRAGGFHWEAVKQ